MVVSALRMKMEDTLVTWKQSGKQGEGGFTVVHAVNSIVKHHHDMPGCLAPLNSYECMEGHFLCYVQIFCNNSPWDNVIAGYHQEVFLEMISPLFP